MTKEKRSIKGPTKPKVFRFDAFELDVASGDLRLGQTHLSLQPQPFKVLVLLVSKSGQIVPREEIKRQLWSTGIFVDFDCGLNFCVRQIRRKLGEDAKKPRFIETVHRRGYRFIAQVDVVDDDHRCKPGAKLSVPLLTYNTPGPIRLAVLPFQILGCPSNNHFLADGITELLITYLSTTGSFRVVSRTTSMQYKHTGKSLAQIGRELGADRVLEGAVLHSGVRVRVTVRLVNSSTDQSEWAACYEAEMQDPLLVQERVACAVACDTAIYLMPKLKEKGFWMPRNSLPANRVLKSLDQPWSMVGSDSSEGRQPPVIARGRVS